MVCPLHRATITRKHCADAHGTTARCGARSPIQNEYRVIQVR